MSTEIVPAEEAPDLATMKRADVPAIWTDYRAKAEALKKTAETLTVTSVDQKAEMKLARATRLSIKDLRVEIDHKRKELGEEALRRKQKIDADAKELRDILEPLEARLLEQEKFAERAEETRKIELKASREKELAAFGVDTQFVDQATMPEEAYDKFYESAQAGFRAKIAAEKKAKEEQEAKAKADAEERQRVQAENERLKKEAAESEDRARAETLRLEKINDAMLAIREGETDALRLCRTAEAVRLEIEYVEKREITAEIYQEKVDAAQQLKAEVLASMRKIYQKRLKEEEVAIAAAKAEQERAAKAKQDIEAAEKKAAEERAAREKLEAEAREREAKIVADKKAADAAVRKAARAPDKQKVMAFASALIALPTPECTTPEGQAITGEINDRVDAFATWLNEKAGAL